MDKCRWEDGEFKACFDNHRLGIVPHISKMQYRYVNPSADEEYYHAFNDNPKYCSYCGADIRKPEPEVIIKQSGGTYVAFHDNEDFFCIDPNKYEQLKHDLDVGEMIFNGIFVRLHEIGITDKIAKLRPMVVTGGKDERLGKLWGVDNKECLSEYTSGGINWWNRVVIRLATVADLEEPNA